jgi:hypothetical protein
MTIRLRALTATVFLAIARAQTPSDEPMGGTQRIQRVRTLLRELTPTNNDEYRRITPAFREDHLGEIRNLVQSGILESLKTSDDAQAIGKVLQSYIDSNELGSGQFIYHYQLGGIKAIVIGYAVRFGGAAISSVRVIIDGYRNTGSGYELAAETGQALEDCTLKMAQLVSPRPNEAWFLAHGQVQYGGSVYKEVIRIYSFDGYKFDDMWAPEAPKENPKFEISKDSVVVTYDGPNLGNLGFHQPVLEDTVHLTANGAVVTTLTAVP